MSTPVLIHDPDDPRLEPYRALRERDLVGRQGRFVAEGDVVLRQMLAAGRFRLESLLVAERRLSAVHDLIARLPPGTELLATCDAIIAATAGFNLHRGLIGIGLRGPDSDPLSLIPTATPAIIVVSIGIANHDNMGGLFRNAAAFGADAVLIDRTSCDPLYRKAIRVSVGGALTVPFARFADADALTDALSRAGFTCIGLTPAGSTALHDVQPPAKTALFVGAEGPGLPRALLDRLDAVSIGMAGGFDSINVATAAALALHHLTRRRNSDLAGTGASE